MCRNKFCAIILIGAALLASPPLMASEPPPLSDTIGMLNDLEQNFAVSEAGKKGELHGLLLAARGEDGANAVLQLWNFQQHTFVQLEWYRSPYRKIRLVVLSLYYATADPDLARFPAFKHDAERYKEEEARERMDEIDFVVSHKAEITGIIQKVIRKAAQ